MPLGDLHREVATIALRAAARHGFALADGTSFPGEPRIPGTTRAVTHARSRRDRNAIPDPPARHRQTRHPLLTSSNPSTRSGNHGLCRVPWLPPRRWTEISLVVRLSQA
jgi:hypothetical protein